MADGGGAGRKAAEEDGRYSCSCEQQPLLGRSDSARSGPGMRRVHAFTALALMADGYEASCFSGAVLLIKQNLGLSPARQGYIVGTGTGAKVLGALFGTIIADRAGRRFTLLLTHICFIAGSLTTATSSNWLVVLAGRLLCGFAYGTGELAIGLYITEVAPTEQRGFMIGLLPIWHAIGMLSGFFINAILLGIENDWRIMLGLGVVLPCICCLFILSGCLPESPLWLRSQGRHDAALEASRLLYADAQVGLDDREQMPVQEEATWCEVLFSNLRSRRLTLLICVTMGCGAVFAGTAILGVYMSWTVADQLGPRTGLIFMVMIVCVALVVSIIANTFFLESVGRRPLIIISKLGESGALIGLAGALHLNTPLIPGIFILYGVLVICSSIGAGAIVAFTREIWDSGARSKGLAIGGVPANLFLIVSLALYPTLKEIAGLPILLSIFAFNSILISIFCYTSLPETRGVPLEKMAELLGEGGMCVGRRSKD